jgi:hypothetical protein
MYTENDRRDKLATYQLELMARSDHDIFIDYLENETIFDAHRIRLLLEFGQDKVRELLEDTSAQPTIKLYDILNDFMGQLGSVGEITVTSESDFADKVMNALYDIDGGCKPP